MPAIDIASTEETLGPKFNLLSSQFVNGDDSSASGTSASYSGFSAFSSVYFVVNVALRQGFRGTPLTVTIEHSDEGSSWSTAHTFSFSAEAKTSVAVAYPKDFVRVLWSSGHGSEWAIISVVAVAPTANVGELAVQRADVVVTSAELLALDRSHAVTVVPAPGVGFALIPQILVASLRFGTTPYDFLSGEPTLGWDTPVLNDQAFYEHNALAEALMHTSDCIVREQNFVDLDEYAYPLGGDSGVENKAIIFYVSAFASHLTGGDGTLRISLVYSVIPVG